MKASELIQELKENIEKYGDHIVCSSDPYSGFFEITGCYFQEETGVEDYAHEIPAFLL